MIYATKFETNYKEKLFNLGYRAGHLMIYKLKELGILDIKGEKIIFHKPEGFMEIKFDKKEEQEILKND
jgi:hypothetical protein